MSEESTENKEPISEFRASNEMPSQKSIAIEHLEFCKGCTQRSTAHAVGVGSVSTENHLTKVLEEAVYAQKQASDILTLNEKLITNINDMMVKLSGLINQSTAGMEEYVKVKQDADKAVKALQKAEEIIKAAKQEAADIVKTAKFPNRMELTKMSLGRYIGVGVGFIITFLTGLAI